MAYKEQLSEHVEKIFMGYDKPGLHICDLATGGGKTHTIGKLTCDYYAKKFDRIVILCVQTRLVNDMEKAISKYLPISTEIKPNQVLKVKKNVDVIKEAISNGSMDKLLKDIVRQNGIQKQKKLNRAYEFVKNSFNTLNAHLKTVENDNSANLTIQIDEAERILRQAIRNYFADFKNYLEKSGQLKNATTESILSRFGSLTKVYPQVEYQSKRVLLMTVQKAMLGIDPILTEKITLSDFTKGKKTLIVFDESDQAAMAMRDTIIGQAIGERGNNKRFAKGYSGYLQYKDLFHDPESISFDKYFGAPLRKAVEVVNSTIQKNWEKKMGKVKAYRSIYPSDDEDLEAYRRGVFFSGPLKLNIAPSGTTSIPYICSKQGTDHFELVHETNEDLLKSKYSCFVPLDSFLHMVLKNITSMKSQLRSVVVNKWKEALDEFDQLQKEVGRNTLEKMIYLSRPTRESTIHSLIALFDNPSEWQFERQLNEFITNRKNIVKKDKNGNPVKLPDYSVYSQGVQLFQEEIDERDSQHRVKLSCREINTTPEKIIIDLLSSGRAAVVLCSATSSSKTVVSNFDIKYIKEVVNDVNTLSTEDIKTFDNLVENTYPKKHYIDIVPIKHFEYVSKLETDIKLPENYKRMFSLKAQEDGSVEEWFKITYRNIKNAEDKKDVEKWCFELYRYFQFIEVYYWFINHDDVHSMIYFQNRTGDRDRKQYNCLACLVDGTYQEQATELDLDIPTWTNNNLRITKDSDEIENDILPELSSCKDAKLMLITAYGSFKAGANLQYKIPEGLDYVQGENWDEKNLEKDWDSMFLQSPTSYLMLTDETTEEDYEKGLHKAMLTLMMLHERGCLSELDVKHCLAQALAGKLYFGESYNKGIGKDKSAWVQTTIEQAVGRLCRTRNKPHTTHILYDNNMSVYICSSNLKKSLTKEFRKLAEYILQHHNDANIDATVNDTIRCNNANKSHMRLKEIRRNALRYNIHKYEVEVLDEQDEDDENGEIPYIVSSRQTMYQSFKHTILCKPVIASLDELTDEDRQLTFIGMCYGDWPRNEANEYHCWLKDNKICPASTKGAKLYGTAISPAYTKLDILMKNDAIRAYFEKNGYATEWKSNGLILHPMILGSEYVGEIGEEAFKALVLEYTNVKEEEFVHLTGKDYEIADFIICNANGSNRIAFDVKNMRPEASRELDNPANIPTAEKRAEKEKRLGCRVITVNMLKLQNPTIDALREIDGMIDLDGNILPEAIQSIKNFIDIQ
ncbi:hypothetical protein [Bacteroides sp.]